MAHFFTPAVLEKVRLNVHARDEVCNPIFYPLLEKIGFRNLPAISNAAAVTFVDVIACQVECDDQLLFHELVHVVQYEKLGLIRFAYKYIKGFLCAGCYDEIPVELNAYALDHRFTMNANDFFSVQGEVQRWLDQDSF